MTRVLCVCLGNICRSPTAQAVFEAQLAGHALRDAVSVDSCGTGGWHAGEPPDRRATAAAERRGYPMSHLRARQLRADDYAAFDYILAMDEDNLADIEAQCPESYGGQMALFLDYAREIQEREVPDPYYGGDAGFEHVLDLIEAASRGLLDTLADADTR